MRPNGFHRRNLPLCSSKRSSRPVVKWVGRIWPDLMKNPCMQSQMPIRNACALNNCMGRSARFHRRNLMKTGSMEAPWLALHWVGMDLQSRPRSTADLRISPIACALLTKMLLKCTMKYLDGISNRLGCVSQHRNRSRVVVCCRPYAHLQT
jgi:hypothetical protein